MKNGFLGWIGLTLTLSFPLVTGPSAEAQQSNIPREGMTDLAQSEAASLISITSKDSRYAVLRRVADERGLRLEPTLAVAKDFAEGYSAVFIPALDQHGNKRGFLANSGEVWALSLSLENGPVKISEGFIARIDKGGAVTVEVGFMTKRDSINPPHTPSKSISAACLYVKNTGFDFGCFALPDNPFGQYYTTYYRYGTNPNPLTYAWWACYKGAAHSCPLNEAPGSPYAWVTCGAPPDHPQG